jgi:hypothetical protein
MFYKILIIAYIPEISNFKFVENLEFLFKSLLEKNNHTFEFSIIKTINKEKIISEMKNIALILEKPFNKSIIYYFGHGDQVKDFNGDELDGKDEIWKTQNILDDEISNIFKNINVDSRLYLFSDSCSSGSMIDKKINNKSWISLSSSNDLQDSLSTSEGGVFTLWGLIPCLENTLKNNSKLSFNDIYLFVKNNIFIDSQT